MTFIFKNNVNIIIADVIFNDPTDDLDGRSGYGS